MVSGIRHGADSSLRNAIQRFRDPCAAEKIVNVQLSDTEKQSPSILPGHPAYRLDEDDTHSWCLRGRAFTLEVEEGGYFPFDEILRAWLVENGWDGWVSMETFYRDMYQENITSSICAERAVISWERIQKLLHG